MFFLFKANASLFLSVQDIKHIVMNPYVEINDPDYSNIGVALQNTRVIVARQKEFISGNFTLDSERRVLIDPFNCSSSHKTFIWQSQNADKIEQLEKYNIVIDEVAVRVASKDIVLLQKTKEWIEGQLELHKTLERFALKELSYKKPLGQGPKNGKLEWKIETVERRIEISPYGVQIVSVFCY